MELKFTPRIINEIEVEKRKPLGEVLKDTSMENLNLLVRKGMKCDKDQAWDAMDKFLGDNRADGKVDPETNTTFKNDTNELYLLVMKSLQDSGFLPRSYNLQKVREEMERKLKEQQDKPAGSAESGNVEKQMPSLSVSD